MNNINLDKIEEMIKETNLLIRQCYQIKHDEAEEAAEYLENAKDNLLKAKTRLKKHFAGVK